MIDLSSLEAVWAVIAVDGIDEPDRILAFCTKESDAALAAAKFTAGTLPDGYPRKLPGGGEFGTHYEVRGPIPRWPTYGERVDAAAAARRADECPICGKPIRGGHERDGSGLCWGHGDRP